jgi:AcrR family transcriptional regulator
MSNSVSRQKILDTAADLFYREGFRATGVDTLAAASGTGKMTLYRHFATKDELIAAYLEHSNQQFWSWFESATAGASTPRARILAFFTALESLVNQPTCHGCPFLNAAVDFPDSDHPGHRLAMEHKDAVRQRFRQLSREAGASEPDLLADHLLLLMDGAFMAVRMYGSQNPASHVARAARVLLDAAGPTGA